MTDSTRREGDGHGPVTFLDRILLRWIPDQKRMRRFVFGSYAGKLLMIVIVLFIGIQVDGNTRSVELTNCVFITVLENAADREYNLGLQSHNLIQQATHFTSARRLELQAERARHTGIHCPPRKQEFPLSQLVP